MVARWLLTVVVLGLYGCSVHNTEQDDRNADGIVSIDEQVHFIVRREGLPDLDGYFFSITSYTGTVETRITLVRTNGSIVDYTYPGDEYSTYQRDTSVSGFETERPPYQLQNPLLMTYTVASLMQHVDTATNRTVAVNYEDVRITGFDPTTIVIDYSGRGGCFVLHSTGDVVPMPEC